jgi:hypothetical protein
MQHGAITRALLTSLRGLTALAASCAFLAWSLINAIGGFGATTHIAAGEGAAAAAYAYQYPQIVAGSGTIQGPNGSVMFSVFATRDSDGGSIGSCLVKEPASNTKIKCLDVTSLSFGGFTGVMVATASGPATENGVPTTYILGVDTFCGTNHAVFEIETATGFHRSGALTSGHAVIQGYSTC